MADPAANDVHATYCLTASLDAGVVRAAVGHLSVEECARHDRFVFDRDRRDFAVAHALLRRALSAHGDRAPHEWTFTSQPHGKPALTPEPADRTRLSFNLAHTDGLVACVIARDASLGIDVEAIDHRADALALASRMFSPIEVEHLEACAAPDRQARFTEIWTLKEAYVKAIGDGLSRPLHGFSFVFDDPSSLRFEPAQDAPASAGWQFALFAPSGRHRMAIVVGGPSARERRLVVRAASWDGGQPSDANLPVRRSVP
jgi:4'-phosphopantetheinyl transferase